jgi:hypothetical protein
MRTSCDGEDSLLPRIYRLPSHSSGELDTTAAYALVALGIVVGQLFLAQDVTWLHWIPIRVEHPHEFTITGLGLGGHGPM